MNFGHCKHCWWWKKTNPIADKGYCFYHRNTTKETTYCPDYYNRKKGNKEDGALDEWINKHPEIRINDNGNIWQLMNEIELWVARDKDGKLYLYRDRPIKDKFVWYSPGFNLLLASASFPEVQWSDDEPTKVSITIKK